MAKHLVRGVLAGVAGGLAASLVMNLFMAGPGKKLTEAVQTDEENAAAKAKAQAEEPDATMKAADGIVNLATGGEHLSHGAQQVGGPIVHYVFGGLMGGVYGGLAEYVPSARAGYGTAFSSALFVGGDVVAVPALKLSGNPVDQPSGLVTPYFAHVVYGLTTEFVRRAVRKLL